jgi:hypothetical protein
MRFCGKHLAGTSLIRLSDVLCREHEVERHKRRVVWITSCDIVEALGVAVTVDIISIKL